MALPRPTRHRQGMSILDPVARSFDGAALPGVLLTEAEYARCRSELEELRRRRDRELPRLLRDARTYVASDAIEEIAQIEGDDAIVQARIAKLNDLLADATIVSDEAGDEDVITLGRTVEVLYLRNGKTATFVITGNGGGAAPRTVSARSPVGQALMGRSRGDVVAVELPGGRVERLRVLSVAPGPDGAAFV
jgi:transcription elongation factor GreA